MLPDEVREAVERMCTPLDESQLSGVTAQEDARCMALIRAHLLAREAEVERLQDSVNALGLQGAEFMARCERAEALLREVLKLNYTDAPDLAYRITAHLSENSRG